MITICLPSYILINAVFPDRLFTPWLDDFELRDARNCNFLACQGSLQPTDRCSLREPLEQRRPQGSPPVRLQARSMHQSGAVGLK